MTPSPHIQWIRSNRANLTSNLSAPEWEAFRQRLFPGDRINLNPGTLGTPSTAILEAKHDFFENGLSAFPLGQYRQGRLSLRSARQRADSVFGVPGVAIAGGTTATVNLLLLALLGLSGRRGEPLRVLSSGHEHYGGLAGFERHPGVDVSYLDDSRVGDPQAVAELASSFDILFLSQVTWTEGRVLPVEAIGEAMAQRGLDCWLMVDAAQSLGLLPPPVGVADVVVGSGHKWLSLPQGTGFLWTSERVRQTLGGLNWSGEALDGESAQARWEPAGGQDFSLYAGVDAGLEIIEAIGPSIMPKRSEYLAEYLAQTLSEHLTSEGVAHTLLPKPGGAAPGFLTLHFPDVDSYPIYDYMNSRRVHVKCIKKDLKGGRSLNALRFTVPYWESHRRLNKAIECVIAGMSTILAQGA